MAKSFLDDWLDNRAHSSFNLGESGVANRKLSEIIPAGRLAGILGGIDFDHNPTRGSDELRSEVASRYEHAEASNVLITAGASEALLVYFMMRRQQGANVVVLTPAFHSLYDTPEALGMEARQVPLDYDNGYRLPAGEIIGRVDENTRCVVLTTPNNPMGTVFGHEEVLALAKALERYDCDILLDEQYRLLPHDSALQRFASAAIVSPRVLSIGSAGKCYGAVGLRVGWCVADQRLVEDMDAVKTLTTHAISKVSDRICLELMRGGDAILQENRTAVATNKARFADVVDAHPERLAWVRPGGGTVAFPKLADGACSREFGARLFDKTDVLVLPGEAFESPGFFRIRLGADRANFSQAMDRLTDFLHQG